MTAIQDIHAFIRDLPKCELHVHLEGTLEADMKFRFAERNAIRLPYADVASLEAAYVFHDLPSFLKVYYEGIEVLRTEADFRELCHAYLAKAHSQNVRHAEMFFDPQAHTARGVPFEAVIRGLRRGQEDAARDFGIQSRLVMCFLRERSAEDAMATLASALPYVDWLAGVGLDSDERGNPPAKFAAVFARARAAGLRITLHCDVDQENTHEHLRQALADIGTDRIDHGVNVLEVPALVALARDRGTVFTLCPFANRVVRGEQAQAPVRQMLSLGLRVTLNSDDPAYMQGQYVAENFDIAQAALQLTPAELLALARHAFEGAWLPADEIATHVAALDDFARSRGLRLPASTARAGTAS